MVGYARSRLEEPVGSGQGKCSVTEYTLYAVSSIAERVIWDSALLGRALHLKLVGTLTLISNQLRKNILVVGLTKVI